tara:strand:+ start:179 stop:748 length:570 start_codon:yes stop_codon:yes gene_type:complete
MWAIVNKDNNSVTEVLQSPKAVIIDNIQHSKDIFKVWGWTELNNIGIYEYVDSGKPDQKFVTSEISYTFDASAKKVTSSYKSTDKNLADLKTQAVADAKDKAYNLIKRFSWLVERYVYDNSKTIPSAVSTYANNVRSKYTALCTSINNCDNMTAFEKLHNDTLDSDNNVTAIAAVNDWPNDSDVKEYER